MSRRRELTHQMVVRIAPSLRSALERDAEVNGRTVAQSVRHYLHRYFATAREGS